MREAPSKPDSINRVMLALDTSLRGLGALDTALALAERNRAELEALFVEDADLFSLARLPFARELDLASGQVRRLDETLITRSLRSHQQRVRGILERAARQHAVAATVRIVRGHYLRTALEAALGTDVLFLSCGGGMRSPYAPRLAGGKPATVTAAPAPVRVLFDGSAAAVRALRLGSELAAADHLPLGAVLLANSSEELESLQKRVHELLDPNRAVKIQRYGTGDSAAQGLASRGGGVLLLPRQRVELAIEGIEPSAADFPLVLVS